MTRIVFAKTRYHYDSYIDFWRLVHLSEFETCFFDEIDFDAPNTVYITSPMNGEQPPHVANSGKGPGQRRSKLVWWDLERPDGGSSPPISQVLNDAFKTADAAWCSDKLVASLDSRFQFVPLGGHSGLRVYPPRTCLYDYTHQSYAWGRREQIYRMLQQRGLVEGPATWGDAREHVMASSRLVLNLQQYELPVIAPLRFALAAAYSLPVVTEQVHNNPTPLLSEDLIQAPYTSIVDAVCLALGRSDLQDLGRAIHYRYCIETTFRKGVELGISQL